MNNEKIKWCLCQKRGIELTEPKPHLSKSYMNEADETLENVLLAKGKWKIITAYYACYSSLYSVLMRVGIRSEIHECTLELMDFFNFAYEEKEFMKNLKDNRIQAQYYLKNISLDNEKPVKEFILKCKIILNSLNSKEIEILRKNISQMQTPQKTK